MLTMDPSKTLLPVEVGQLRGAALLWKTQDLDAGRYRGVLAWMVIDLLLHTGIRATECAELTVGSVCQKHKQLIVRRLKKKREWIDRMQIPPSLVRHVGDFIAWKKLRGEDVSPAARLLVGQRGPITRKAVYGLVCDAMERAGIEGHFPHSCRHTYATHLMRTSRNVKMVQKQLGHSRIETTAQYVHALTDEIDHAIERMYA